jgi:glycosyltransferase involved in cell wall biosynthesis
VRVAINLLTDHPDNPTGAHWGWSRTIPEMAKLLTPDEEFLLVVSPRSRPLHEGYGDNVRYITFPWSNEAVIRRTLSEHLYAPLRLPLSGVDIFSTLIAPLVKPAPSLVAHFKTMHAYATPQALRPANRIYRRMGYPHTAKTADAIILNSMSLLHEVQEYLDVDPAKLHIIPEAVDHELFRPGDRDEAKQLVSTRFGVNRPFVLFVSSLWRYKNCHGLFRAFAAARPQLGDRQLVIVGAPRDEKYVAELHELAEELGIAKDVLWVGGVPLHETVHFYRSCDVFAYPSFNETFGLPILEAMASGCPVVTSDLASMPEIAGSAALLVDPGDPESIADALIRACGPTGEELRAAGLARAAEFTWATTAERTLAVYRQVYAQREQRRRRPRRESGRAAGV